LLTFTRRILPHARIVFTLHEFLAICNANGQMVRLHDQMLCDRASPTRCHQCFPDRPPEAFFLRDIWIKRQFGAVDVFTTPSRFMIAHYVTWGLARERIVHVTNGQRDYAAEHGVPASRPSGARRNRFGFFGQLVDQKAVWLILQAVAHLRARGFEDFSVEINGDNLRYASEERRAEIAAFREAEAARPFEERRVAFNGHYDVGQLAARMGRVDWCIVPSVWWETFALVISEAWMFGRPVIASDIGAMRERISDEVDGMLFAAGDAQALAATMVRAATEDGLHERLVAGIRPPPTQAAMVRGMLDAYRAEAPVAALADVR
jgi:glycosyltransferase involved in cell wall biosynthesis